MPELIDTHVHLDDSRLLSQLDKVLDHAKQMNVVQMVNVGHNLKSSVDSVLLAAKHDNIWATVGFHPHSALDYDQDSSRRLAGLAGAPRVVAIGEIGLDYHYNFSPASVQRQVFREQLDLALALNLPVVIHQREAVADSLKILDAAGPFPQGGIMHCFSASVEVMERCLGLGLSVGIGGAVTFLKAQYVKDVAIAVPLNRLVLETDSPYMAPHPFRGKTNQPGYLPWIAAEIAKLRRITTTEVIKACTQNARTLYNI